MTYRCVCEHQFTRGARPRIDHDEPCTEYNRVRQAKAFREELRSARLDAAIKSTLDEDCGGYP